VLSDDSKTYSWVSELSAKAGRTNSAASVRR